MVRTQKAKKNTILFFFLLFFTAELGCHAFQSTYFKGNSKRTCHNSELKLTPIGPFCHFRSSASVDADPKIEEIYKQAPTFATEMERVQLDMQMGEKPDSDMLFRVADGIDQAVSQWEVLLTRLKLSGDFQTTEYSKLNEIHLSKHGVTPTSIVSMMRWQAGCMRALALNAPPPMPPSDLDLTSLMSNSQYDESAPSINKMANAEVITSIPFGDESLKNEIIRKEYENLCQEHSKLIEFGAKYSEFDSSGKLIYLNQIEEIEDRWDVFYTRFSLMDELNPIFTQQCNAFLSSMNLNEQQFRQLLREAHNSMREDAKTEE